MWGVFNHLGVLYLIFETESLTESRAHCFG